MTIETCRHCQYWVARAEGPTEVENLSEADPDTVSALKRRLRFRRGRGQCRRYAPKPAAFTLYWPATNDDDWCGEFVKRKALGLSKTPAGTGLRGKPVRQTGAPDVPVAPGEAPAPDAARPLSARLK